MPTNLLRSATKPAQPSGAGHRRESTPRVIAVTAGPVTITATLAETPTAERLWAALPLFSTAERWGDSLHFEVPIESGRERGARGLAQPGEIYFWIDDDRILIPFGPTPISRPGETRLPRPCNVLAHTGDDLAALKVVTPGEKVSVRRVAPRAADTPRADR